MVSFFLTEGLQFAANVHRKCKFSKFNYKNMYCRALFCAFFVMFYLEMLFFSTLFIAASSSLSAADKS